MASKRSDVIITLPQEMITEILYRLPSKSIGRFRSVSKEWLSLLTQPAFIKTHQNSLNQNHLILMPPSSVARCSLYLLPFHRIEEEPKQCLPYETGYDGNLDVIGCRNGLVLVSVIYMWLHGHMVFNPTTNDCVLLPFWECCIDHSECGHVDFKQCFLHGFGYDIVNDDYKVVSVVFHEPSCSSSSLFKPDDHVPALHVYSLRTQTWKHVIDFPYNPFYPEFMSSSHAFANGNIHWIANYDNGNDGDDYFPEIVAFSLADESISQVPLPDNILADSDCHYCQLVDLGGKLCIFVSKKLTDDEVWLMNEYGVKESWTKISLHDIPEIDQPPFFHKDDTIRILRDNLMLIYDVEEKSLCKYEATTLYSLEWEDSDVEAICVESLVSPKYRLSN